MPAFRDVAVYFGLADETVEDRRTREAALLQTSAARLLLGALLGAVVAGAIVGLARCLLDGEAVTVARVLDRGVLVAVVVAIAGVSRALWDRRRILREQAQRPPG